MNARSSPLVEPACQQASLLKAGDSDRVMARHQDDCRLQLVEAVKRCDLQQDCMTVAADHEVFYQARATTLQLDMLSLGSDVADEEIFAIISEPDVDD